MSIKWIPTSDEVYTAIRKAHHEKMVVHGTFTDMGEYGSGQKIMTEWGLHGADYPTIKYEQRDEAVTFWIAVITIDNDESAADNTQAVKGQAS